MLVLIGAWTMVTIAPGRLAPAVLVLGALVMELGGGVFDVIQLSLRQALTTAHLQGRRSDHPTLG